MIWILLVAGLILALTIGLAAIGFRSRLIFTNPNALSDRQVTAIIDLTRQIMSRTLPGSPPWSRAAAKHKAAVDEQARRRGETPFDNIELIEPRPIEVRQD